MDSKIEEKEQMTLYIGGNMIVLDKSKDVVKKSNCPEFFQRPDDQAHLHR